MKKETLILRYDPNELERVKKLIPGLEKLGYVVSEMGEVSQEGFILLLLGPNTTKEGLLKANPWLSEQFEDSSFHGFRMMPILPYYGNKEDVDSLWGNGIGDLYEELISGEFKPFGFDLDNENATKEFDRVYEEYC